MGCEETVLRSPFCIDTTLKEIKPLYHNGIPAYTAWHLAVWYRDNRFCGSCLSLTAEIEQTTRGEDAV
ncbi:MAG: hypothetical protein IJ849_11780 [Selenomonadaceae bacterium]|nr:hypothetical protein [Selenomonadaceae bacterium]